MLPGVMVLVSDELGRSPQLEGPDRVQRMSVKLWEQFGNRPMHFYTSPDLLSSLHMWWGCCLERLTCFVVGMSSSTLLA